jgi:hypothetical protein
MLSMLAEDVIGPLVGISVEDSGHVIRNRIPGWITDYANRSVMYWPSSSNETVKYYASNYAFGAYLVRNFGGPELLTRMAKSTSSGRRSVDGALRSLNGRGTDTVYAMSRFGEALLYSGHNRPKGGLTFDQTAEASINGTSYVFYEFDIYASRFSPKGPSAREYKDLSSYAAPPNTVQLYTDENWHDEIVENNGGLNIRFLNVDPDADYYIITKPK